MKTIQEIISQETVFLNGWKDKIGVIGDFEDIFMSREEYEAKESPYGSESYWLENKAKMDVAVKRYKDVNILFASYGHANYQGDAWVLFEQEGKLYEVSGSHCSCYGLEGQWEPEDVLLEELEHRLIKGTFGEDPWSENNFKEELCEFLGVELKPNKTSQD